LNDKQLATAIRNRDERAIDYAINKYSKLLWKVASAALAVYASAEEIEECVADVFIYLWQNPEKFDPSRGSLKSWLCILARSRALDRYRLLSRHSTIELSAALSIPTADISENLIREEDISRLNAALDALGEPEREINAAAPLPRAKACRDRPCNGSAFKVCGKPAVPGKAPPWKAYEGTGR